MKTWCLPLCILAAACGDKSNDGPTAPTCAEELSSFQPCGGNVVGAWTATSACGEATTSPLAGYPACPPSSWKTSIAPSGTITFGADGKETDAFASTISETVTMSDACFAAAFADQTPGPDACTALTENLKGFSGGTGSCAYAAGTCTCQVAISIDDHQPARTYVVSGSTLTYPEETTKPLPYCISGGVLRARVDGGEGAYALYELHPK